MCIEDADSDFPVRFIRNFLKFQFGFSNCYHSDFHYNVQFSDLNSISNSENARSPMKGNANHLQDSHDSSEPLRIPNSENALRRGRFRVNASLSNSQVSLPSIPTYEWHALGDDRRRLLLHHLACREARRRERAMTMPAPEATSTARAACGRGASPVFAKPADP